MAPCSAHRDQLKFNGQAHNLLNPFGDHEGTLLGFLGIAACFDVAADPFPAGGVRQSLLSLSASTCCFQNLGHQVVIPDHGTPVITALRPSRIRLRISMTAAPVAPALSLTTEIKVCQCTFSQASVARPRPMSR